MSKQISPTKEQITNERVEILEQLEQWLEKPMIVLGFLWLALIVAQLVWGLHPFLQDLGIFIWLIFILDFLLKFTIAPHKLPFLKSNWLTAIALVVPALRIFRIFSFLSMLPSSQVTLVSMLASFNRGMRALGATMGRRGLKYVVALTLTVTLLGAAGMYAFEKSPQGQPGINTYGYAVWWTAMIMTTLGSDYFPHTSAGRLLCFLLSVYAFSVFGYITASIATYFVNRDADDEGAELAGTKNIEALRAEIAALREEIRAFAAQKQEQKQ